MTPKLRNQLRETASDALLFAGVVSVTWCAHLIYPPAAFGVGGAFAIALGWTVGRELR